MSSIFNEDWRREADGALVATNHSRRQGSRDHRSEGGRSPKVTDLRAERRTAEDFPT